MNKPNIKKKFSFLGLCSVSISLVGCYGLADATNPNEVTPVVYKQVESKPPSYRPIPHRYQQINQKEIAESTPTYPAIASTSNPSQIALAKYLKRKKVKFYGAWWCPHCHEQKELFGKQAFKFVSYVECADVNRSKPQKEACTKADVRAYPTWIIRGKKVEGVQSLRDLANLSGYRGKRNFPAK